MKKTIFYICICAATFLGGTFFTSSSLNATTTPSKNMSGTSEGYVCMNCAYVHEGELPPSKCPGCGLYKWEKCTIYTSE